MKKRKSEANLWANLRDGTRKSGIHWTRMEAWSIPGIPDINGCYMGKEFWIELKIGPIRENKGNCSWRPHQVAWQSKRAKAGGIVWNWVFSPSTSGPGRLLLIRGEELFGSLTDGRIVIECEFDFPECDADWMKIINYMIGQHLSI